MKFVGVEFTEEGGGGLAIVHHQWVTPRKTEVWWPPYKQQSAFSKALQKGECPQEESWKVYKINRIYFEEVDYDIARKKLKLCEDTSDIPSDWHASTEIGLNSKRTRRTTQRLLDSDDSEDEHPLNKVSRPPRVDRESLISSNSSRNHTIALHSVQTNHSSERATSSKSFNDELQLNRISLCTGSNPTDLTTTSETESYPHTSTPPGIPCVLLKSKTSQQSPTHLRNFNEPYLNSNKDELVISGVANDQFWRILVELREQNKQILAHIKKSESLNNNSVEIPSDIPVQLPLGTFQDVQSLNNYLLEDKQNILNLSIYLSRLGGRDLITKTNKILTYLLKDILASEFSFRGSRASKHSFSELALKTIVIEAVKKSTPNATDKQVEDAVKVWLKNASKRLKRVSTIK